MWTGPSLSRPATFFPWLILAGTVLLAGVLAASTWANLERERELMEVNLQRQGLTLIRAFEAGARGSLMRQSRLELDSLVQEAFHQGLMSYVIIVNADRKVAAAAGAWEGRLNELPLTTVMTGDEGSRRYALDSDGKPVLEVGERFDPLRLRGPGRGRRLPPPDQLLPIPPLPPPLPPLAIFIGVSTAPFDQERQELITRGMLQGGGLLLLGTAGLVTLFLAQRNRVADATLRNLELYTRNVIDNIPGGLLTVNSNGRVVAHNPQAAELLGQPPGGKSLDSLLGSASPKLVQAILAGETVDDQALELPQDDGGVLPLTINASPLRDTRGRRVGMVIILKDQRALRAMEEQLERSRRHAALGQMAAGIAHEIRNPLGTLRGFAEYFAELREHDAAAGDYADTMISEVDRLDRTIASLLQYASPRVPERQPLLLTELAQRVRKLVAPDIDAAGLTLTSDIPAGLSLSADPDLLLQVLLNLLQNAVAATAAGGQIQLRADDEGDQLRLTVRDSGQGMPPQVRQHMFDPFFTTRKTGTGLGLAVVHQIMEQHGARIEVDSTEGRGTSIALIFPQETTS
jgi:two-component system sensor histidine kinase HydH